MTPDVIDLQRSNRVSDQNWVPRGTRGGAVREKVFVIVAVAACAELLRNQLERGDDFEVVGIAVDGDAALRQIELIDPPPDIVLLDVGAHLALETARTLRGRETAIRLIAIGLDEDPAQVLSWAVVGATGLVARTASLNELLSTLAGVARGEASCSSGVSGALLRGVGSSNTGTLRRRPSGGLTHRQWEVARLVGAGFTNKEIAAHLQIEPGTVKSHVHSVIRTLGVSRRAQVAPKLRRDGLISEWPEWLTEIEGSVEAAERDGAAGDPELRGAGHNDGAEPVEQRLRSAPR